MTTQISSTLEEVISSLERCFFTEKEFTDDWDTGVAEHEDVTSLWGFVQGLTATARQLEYADRRVDLERRAGALLGSRSQI